MDSKIKFVPYKPKRMHYIRRNLMLCGNCCFHHTDHVCQSTPCRSEDREDKQDGYYVTINK